MGFDCEQSRLSAIPLVAVTLAELEVYHSRPVAPTRRVALGRLILPVNEDNAGFGGLLLGAVVARYARGVHADLRDDLRDLTYEVERGQRISQPRLRHRLQQDRIGLSRSVHRLSRGPKKKLHFSFEKRHDAPAQFVLAAVYAVGTLEYAQRPHVMDVIRRAIGWRGTTETTEHLIGFLSPNHQGFALSAASHNDPVEWALEVLGMDAPENGPVDAALVQKQFRAALRTAHPDFGGESDDAADRIAEITEARRILLPKA